ncbi:MAG: type II secretion system F family protein [Phycisphaerae bacterium]|nr:type II secretion system F family protein [Phycisphaerae bacterium]
MSDPQKVQPLRPAELISFNEQFAQLAAAGLPVEYGLRLVADDLKRGRLADSVRALADELERGVPLPEAFARHAGRFPPLYVRLIDAGIRSNQLAALLMNLGRHLETMRRLRAALWRTFAYPIMVLLLLAIVLVFVSQFVLPQFKVMAADISKVHPFPHYDFATRSYVTPPPFTLPWPTLLLLSVGSAIPIIVPVVVFLIVGVPWILRRMSRDSVGIERLTFNLPFIGTILHRNLIARWCDAAALATSSGLDLPSAIRLASRAIHSPGLAIDGADLAENVETGKPLDASRKYAVLPATVPAAMELASRTNSLPISLESLAELYEKQCELRLENLPALLSPFLLALMAILIGFVIAGITLPIVEYIRLITSG